MSGRTIVRPSIEGLCLSGEFYRYMESGRTIVRPSIEGPTRPTAATPTFASGRTIVRPSIEGITLLRTMLFVVLRLAGRLSGPPLKELLITSLYIRYKCLAGRLSGPPLKGGSRRRDPLDQCVSGRTIVRPSIEGIGPKLTFGLRMMSGRTIVRPSIEGGC